MSSKPFFSFGNSGVGYNINVESLKFNNLNTGYLYLGNTGLAGKKQIQTIDIDDYAVTSF